MICSVVAQYSRAEYSGFQLGGSEPRKESCVTGDGREQDSFSKKKRKRKGAGFRDPFYVSPLTSVRLSGRE